MRTAAEFEALVSKPREDIAVEYKDWLDLSLDHGRATITRTAIALANHGGGFIVLGFAEQGEALVSQPQPENFRAITQDAVNAAVRRYADPEFHVEVYRINHPRTGNNHVILSVPGDLTVPVMSKRDCEGVIAQNRCYIRKPGPRSEEPKTGEEWRIWLHRCVRAQRSTCLGPSDRSSQVE
jgi:predicted HTH transcriptional regulator